ncbi:Kinetochore Mis14 [Penicillium malachiteum]|uniref:Kinetochore Mis14 n=1 Tax=Penicillium malachiteum TaxID=1324776 RepID=UPI0025486708|nr:Kinetochore Mis14 [Penicillium malachiteum]KAJ5736188.1 Kinetochore Mis14 [Penicillium malachiteum]
MLPYRSPEPAEQKLESNDIVCGGDPATPSPSTPTREKQSPHHLTIYHHLQWEPPHYRKIELQSPADFTYLYANTVALSRQKLDLNLPPSASNDDTPDPMRERVRELVDDYITRTFTTASSSISINGIDSSHPQFPFPASFTAPETVEYEPFDSELASRVSALYAQLESLTTTVAQLRRDAPRQAAKSYATQLRQLLKEEGEEDEEEDNDVDEGAENTNEKDNGAMDVDENGDGSSNQKDGKQPTGSSRSRRSRRDPEWELQIPLGTREETERWRSGDMADVYENTLRTLQRLQGEADADEEGSKGNALATTVGKAERAGRAADVVEKM